MKTAIVNTKDYNMAECLSPSRFVDYSIDDFKDIKLIKDLANLCPALLTKRLKSRTMIKSGLHPEYKNEYEWVNGCKHKCKLREFIINNKDKILKQIEERKMEELKRDIKARKDVFDMLK